VFEELDGEGTSKITRTHLEQYNKLAGMNLTKNDMDLMINFASRDGLKVCKDDLFDFLNT
jgi:Ca2+-binding EF-hand superfamily protein